MGQEETNGRPKITTVGRAKAFVVSKWLRKHAEEIRAKKLTIEQVGELAGNQNDVGQLTPNNIRSICRDFGIDPVWSSRTGGLQKGGRSGTSKYLARQILAVAGEVDRLFRTLGETFNPDGVVDLAGLRKVARGELPDSEKPAEPAAEAEPPKAAAKVGEVRNVG